MKIKYLSLAILIYTLFIIGCKKGADDPFISLRSRQARLTGKWEAKSFLINNEDQLNSSNSDYFICNTGKHVFYTSKYTTNYFFFTFEKNGDFELEWSYSIEALDVDRTYDFCDDFYDYTSDIDKEYGIWSFTDKKENIELIIDGGKETWELIELRNNQLTMQLVESGDIYKLSLEKK